MFDLVVSDFFVLKIICLTLSQFLVAVGWLTGWSIGWLVDWLIGWLVDWLIGRLVGWLIGWLVELVDILFTCCRWSAQGLWFPRWVCSVGRGASSPPCSAAREMNWVDVSAYHISAVKATYMNKNHQSSISWDEMSTCTWLTLAILDSSNAVFIRK